MQNVLRVIFGALMWIGGGVGLWVFVALCLNGRKDLNDLQLVVRFVLSVLPWMLFYGLYRVAGHYDKMRGGNRVLIAIISTVIVCAIVLGIVTHWESVWKTTKGIAIAIGMLVFGIAFLAKSGARPDPIPDTYFVVKELEEIKRKL